jgi:adhesin transport system membrane fusion protein
MTPFRFYRPGAGSLLLFTLAIFIAWAAWFEIDQIVRASGQVIPQERVQVIQAADGGVLKALNASEGETVRKGQVLALLESERAGASFDEVRNRIAGLEIARLRAQAEAQGEELYFGAYRLSHPDLVRVQLGLHRQIVRAHEQEVKTLAQQYELVLQEYEMTERLHKAGDVSLVELLRVQKMLIEARQNRQLARDKFLSEARKELVRIEDEITSQRSKYQERQSIYEHTTLQAPMDGVVKFMRLNTVGGVLRPGDELMQIVPTDSQYVVEARVNPADVAQLEMGQAATLRMDAFDYSLYGPLNGKLTYISADTLTETGPDGRSNASYYRARLAVVVPQDSRIQPADIKPGMTVTVDLKVGKRSVLNYLIKPIARGFSGALGQR